MNITIEIEVEIEGDFKPGKDAVQPHAGNTDGTPPEGPEIKIKKVLFPAESRNQIDLLPYLNAATLVEIEDEFQEYEENRIES